MSPLSIILAIPLIPFFLVAWLTQRSASKVVDKTSKIALQEVSEKVLRQYLDEHNLAKVEVDKSSDYSQNYYSVEDGKIYLSPDVMGAVDVCSVATALRAGAKALSEYKGENPLSTIGKIRSAQTLVFWIAFGIVAVGVMASSISISVCGYLFVIVAWGLGRYRHHVEKKIDQSALDFARSSKAIPENLFAEFEKATAALRNL